MLKLFNSVILSSVGAAASLAVTCSVAAVAASSLQAPAVRAAAALHAAAQRLNAAQAISFAAIDARFDKHGKEVAYSISGLLAKPNRASISVLPLGSQQSKPAVMIRTDGKTYSVASTAKNQYVTSDSPKKGIDPESTETMFFLYNVIGNPGPAGLNVAETLLPADFDLDDDKVPAGIKRIVTTTSRTLSVGSHSSLDVAQKVVGARHTSIYHTLIDPRTNALLALSTESVVNGVPKLTERITFTSLKLSNVEPAPAAFAFAPSAGLTQYHAPAAPGTLAPDFTAVKPDGGAVHLADYKGKVVVIDFWATWCPPCLATLPSTDKLAALYQPQGVVFMPVCTWDSKARFDAWLPKHATWTMSWLFDTAGEAEEKSIASTQYAVAGIPAQYVIGKDGKIVYRGFADSDAGEKPLVEAIKAAMAAS